MSPRQRGSTLAHQSTLAATGLLSTVASVAPTLVGECVWRRKQTRVFSYDPEHCMRAPNTHQLRERSERRASLATRFGLWLSSRGRV